jgi:UDP-N-acetylglucosamine 2-epimerase (non-hydrolysing)
MKKIVFIWGTRPEALKIGPVVAQLPDSVCVSTGQHSELLKGTPAESDLSRSISLNLESQGDVSLWVGKAVPRLEKVLEGLYPIGAVVVQGDTMSAYAGALAASKLRIPICHIEAGLRSGDLDEPWPEERIRRAISLRATWHYAPTRTALCNLLREKVPLSRILVTGNPIVSAIHRYADPTPQEVPDNQVLVTMHRREWIDLGRACVLETIDALFESATIYPDIRFIWPMHPGVLKVVDSELTNAPQNVSICPPMAYRATISTLKASLGLATDSGGLCEEAATLGVPCAILRNVTDRPEAVDAGVAKLFQPGPEGMRAAVRCLVGKELPRKPTEIYGTKDSASLIATELARLVQLS